MYVAVKDLPDHIKNALTDMGYHRPDVRVEAAEQVSPEDVPTVGSRCYFLAIDLGTGERKVTHGSWGGPNPFNPHNVVDTDSTDYALRPGLAVIKGQSGHTPMATVYVHPDSLAPLLPEQPTINLTEDERYVLIILKALNPAGRKNDMERNRFGKDRYAAAIANLATLGLVKVNKAGAAQITTRGKNLANYRDLK